ncbi:MAG: histidine--tRNA ligase [Deltaproteobacteria bacterium]|jgi:histidyl-tRNA synthetase|nr:histidine--tRNA ligase [Deltaproteobacteria bacterium]
MGNAPPEIRAVKGFADLFEPWSALFTRMEDAARRVFGAYGYQEARLPLLEYADLFSRAIGEETDVVRKEMFTFPDRGGRLVTLRPEATAGVLRACLENGLHKRESQSKIFCCGPMFRYERPQKGRMRQFHQLDCEWLGAAEPQADAELILMLLHFLEELNIRDLCLELNTLGCPVCRPSYMRALGDFLRAIPPEEFCENCRRRVMLNPLRVLDCKEAACQALTREAPRIPDHVCPECAGHFAAVLDLLDRHQVACTLNPRLVRGLDYYTRTAFELLSSSIGAQSAVAGGGRYDGLATQLGGPDIPGAGFACGLERLALLMAGADREKPRPDFFIAAPGAAGTALSLAQILRRAGLRGESAFSGASLKSQMRQAARSRARFCLILGEEELAGDAVSLRDMDTAEQRLLSQADLPAWALALRSENGAAWPARDIS